MKKFWQWFITALLVAIFLSLANWQWNRASELKNPPKVDQTVFPIDSVISPIDSIKQDQVGKRVSLSGKYVSLWIAPNQKNNQSYDVGLFQTKDNAMILILRGFHKENTIVNNENVNLVGYLVPPQSKDVAENNDSQISRIDSALFVTKTELPLYAPFIQVISEQPTSGYKVVPFNLRSGVPGFYWQHISYVVIWFLFALTTIYLLFYQRRLDRSEMN